MRRSQRLTQLMLIVFSLRNPAKNAPANVKPSVGCISYAKAVTPNLPETEKTALS